MGSRPPPSPQARAALRTEAAALDVEDLVDLCCTGRHDAVRVAIYLEALRQKSGGGEKVQLGALLLCFDLARNGDESRDTEVQLLLPVVDALAAREDSGVVAALTERSEAVLALWTELVGHAQNRDMRAAAAPDAIGQAIEISLFDDEDIVELEVLFDDVMVIEDEAAQAFDRGFDAQLASGGTLFSAENAAELDRLERLQESARSFSSSVPMAAETRAMTALFLATHTRALGLFGRRNKQRDAALREALIAFANLPQPPWQTAAWFIPAADLQTAVPHAWEKMAEVLLDFAGFVGVAVEAGTDPTPATFFDDIVRRYVADRRSAQVPDVLAAHGQRRRR